MPQEYYITFGFDSIFKDHYVKITAMDQDNAREVISENFKLWAGIYSESEWIDYCNKHDTKKKLCTISGITRIIIEDK